MARRPSGAMHVVKVISRQKDREYVSYLLRQSYREGEKVRKRTIANLSALPVHIIDAIRRGLAGDPLLPHEPFHIQQSWPHGHVAAVLGTARKMGLEALIDARASRQRDLVLAMVVARVLHPASKLATTRLWTATSLARTLGVEAATEED
ncbi:MAG TPA: transposase, partial [Chloroflexota bacterium]